MTQEVQVLDHGYVKLIDYMGTDETVIEAARMSTGRGFEGWEEHKRCLECGATQDEHINQDARLLKWAGVEHFCPIPLEERRKYRKAGDLGLLEFLYMNRHMTPFEMGELCIEVKAPIFVFREWHRHRTQSYNEFSARYSVMPNEHYVPEPARIQLQHQINKQGSGESMPDHEADEICLGLHKEQDDVYGHYAYLIEKGVAKEVARINTPVSRYSKMRAKTDVRNWLGFLQLRCEKNAQWEIRQYANAVAQLIRSLWPRTYALFIEHDFLSVRFSRTEMRALRKIVTGVPVAVAVVDAGISGKAFERFIDKLQDDKELDYTHLVDSRHGAERV